MKNDARPPDIDLRPAYWASTLHYTPALSWKSDIYIDGVLA